MDRRDNNFNLIRLFAAWGVMVTHSYALIGLPPNAEPLRNMVGISFGTVAVDTFFVTSGYLVAGSLIARSNLYDFLRSRILRIYPALVLLGGLMLLMASLVTTQTPGKFFGNREVLEFSLRNVTLLAGVSFYLPGVFESNPFPKAVNASLWTLPYEVWLYVSLAVSGWFANKLGRSRLRVLRGLLIGVALLAIVAHIANHFYLRHEEHISRLTMMFYVGAAWQAAREKIPLKSSLFLATGLILLLSAPHPAWFFVAYHILLVYLLMYVAHRPAGPIRAFNRCGDYSYGVYLYAFPVQQTLAYCIPGISLATMLGLSTLLTFVFAWISWHGLEKRALALKPERGTGG